ncbi:MAG TPA: hypothetical protein PL009_04800 [Flavipsychrobacter sp.]|nr:hypothetical protein [Flavipsychrobacter sp.]
MKSAVLKFGPVILLTAVVILSRLPQLFSEHLVLDGDESIVGLMAKHLSEGKEISYFFWGQSYGFSLVETGIIAIGFKFFSVSDYTVKIAMLALWLIAVLVFYKTSLTIFKQEKSKAILLTLVLILLPAWGVWAMKARGGYLTAFLLSNIVLYLFFKKQDNMRFRDWLLCGAFGVTIFFSQPFFLAGLLPFLLFFAYRKPIFKKVFPLALGVGGALAIFLLLRINTADYWKPHVLQIPFKHYGFADFFQNFFHHCTGYYYLNEQYKPPLITTITAAFFILTLLGCMGVAVYRLQKKIHTHPLLLPALASVVVTAGYAFVIDMSQLRYFLPFTGYSLLFVGTVFYKIRLAQFSTFMAALFLIVCGISIYSFRGYKFDKESQSDVYNLIGYLQSKNITHVFCKDSQLQWKLMFYSHEKVIARYVYATDRKPKYVKEVNAALQNNPQRVAVITFMQSDQISLPQTEQKIGRFFIYTNITRSEIERLGFKF